MKSRFTTIDIASVITEIKSKYLGMRVANVYDVDNKTYLIKLQKTDSKAMLLLESGIRIHSTDFQWPKNMMPSGFSMKLRKHLRTRRLESIEQLGVDRIIDLQFGSNEAAYHVILELYDRGNMVLTDYEYNILNILRTRTDDSQDVRFAVREKYPFELARQHDGVISQDRLMAVLLNAKEGDNLKKVLNPHLVYGPAVIDHALLTSGILTNASIGKGFTIAEDMAKLMAAMVTAEEILQKAQKELSKGFIIQKKEKKAVINEGEEPEELLTYQEFHPILYKQHENQPYIQLDSFDKAVDEFFSKIGSQKLDVKMIQQEKAALKKLENVKNDHEKRIASLQSEQDRDSLKAQLIEINLSLVDRAIVIVNTALANQIDWQDIQGLVTEAQAQGDLVASAIKSLKLDSNHITILLKDPYMDQLDEDDDEDCYIKPLKVDIDLALSAYANARKYYDMKRHAVKKEQKTVEASGKALKSAERKTKESLKEMQTVATINKARKTYWFEKFLWFVTSENLVVIGGRDQQQNELIVKKYMKPGDLYVHADLHGASSCILKNPSGEPVPPKSLNEAGCMALCNSAAWDARVVTSAWWVNHHQVSKTAPTGEYLTTGSFMIRGKKNYLPPSYLVYGFGFMFRLDETSIFRHKDERKVKTFEEDVESIADSIATESDITDDVTLDHDEQDSDSDSDENESNAAADGNNSDKELTQPSSDALRKEGNLNKDSKSQETLCDDLTSIKKENVKKEVDSDSEEESMFPDTTIELQHVKGGKFRLQRGERSVSGSSQISHDDGLLPEDMEDTSETVQKPSRLSAKQRRELKKQKKKPLSDTPEEEGKKILEAEEDQPVAETQPKQNEEKKGEPQAPPAKRGQRAKQKKIKDKYADQDEEERQLRLELLGSAGAPKEDKKKNKKKNKQKEVQRQQKEIQLTAQNKPGGAKPKATGPPGRKTLEDIKVDTLVIDDDGTAAEVDVKNIDTQDDGVDSDEEKQAILDEENIQITQDADILDALTGQPVQDDILLFAIPVCAPYSCLVNYKYKVKLLPGTTKRGKAAKTALHMFQQDKNTTQREKDLFKSLKDVDLSRNMPGKVKVSAPNLQKSKKGR